MTDCPGEDGVAGDHQVVDGQGDQGAVVGGHAGRPEDLEVWYVIYITYSYNFFYNKLKCQKKIPTGCSLDKKTSQSATFWRNFNCL